MADARCGKATGPSAGSPAGRRRDASAGRARAGASTRRPSSIADRADAGDRGCSSPSHCSPVASRSGYPQPGTVNGSALSMTRARQPAPGGPARHSHQPVGAVDLVPAAFVGCELLQVAEKTALPITIAVHAPIRTCVASIGVATGAHPCLPCRGHRTRTWSCPAWPVCSACAACSSDGVSGCGGWTACECSCWCVVGGSWGGPSCARAACAQPSASAPSTGIIHLIIVSACMWSPLT
jgi:hypothetical protein